MSKYIKPSEKIKSARKLPLINLRQTTLHAPTTAGGRFIKARFNVPSATADVIAELACLGGNAER